jgi:hypothetical protein
VLQVRGTLGDAPLQVGVQFEQFAIFVKELVVQNLHDADGGLFDARRQGGGVYRGERLIHDTKDILGLGGLGEKAGDAAGTRQGLHFGV